MKDFNVVAVHTNQEPN